MQAYSSKDSPRYRLQSGPRVPHIDQIRPDICITGQNWRWDGIYFEILNPSSLKEFGKSRKSGNNRSCVLRVSSAKQSILLTGDIEKSAEKKLVAAFDDVDDTLENKLASNILVAPHHGSNTSSTMNFIQKVAPEYVLYPTGYRNRYGFPKKRVTARYQREGIKEANTADTGAITFNTSANNISPPLFYRDKIRRFWHHL